MSNERINFRNQVRSRGEDIYRDSMILGGLIADVFTSDERLRNMLKMAIAADIPTKILTLLSMDDSQQGLEITKIIQSFSDNFGIKESNAQEAVYTLALGLGIQIDEVDLQINKVSPGVLTI